jgi:hypothetical protein
MPQIPVYNQQNSQAQMLDYVRPVDNRNSGGIFQGVAEIVGQTYDKIYQQQQETFATQQAGAFGSKAGEILANIRNTNSNPATWGQAANAELGKLRDGMLREIDSPLLRAQVEQQLNRQVISGQLDMAQQAVKFNQDQQLTNTQLASDQFTASYLENHDPQLLEQHDQLWEKAHTAGLISGPQMIKAKENIYRTDILNTARTSIGLAKSQLEAAPIGSDEKVTLGLQLDNMQRQQVAEAQQASMLAKMDFEYDLRSDPGKYTREDVLSLPGVTVKDKQRLVLELQRAQTAIGATPEMQADIKDKIANSNVNLGDVNQVRALEYYYNKNNETLTDSQKVGIVTNSGYVPSYMVNQLATAAVAGNAEQQVQAAQIYNQINLSRPEAAKRAFSDAVPLAGKLANINSLIQGGASPQSAVETATKSLQAASMLTKEQRQAITKDASRFAKKGLGQLQTFVSANDRRITFWDDEFGRDAETLISTQLQSSYQQYRLAAYSPENAEAFAQRDLRTTTGLTQAGTAPQIILYPPEKFGVDANKFKNSVSNRLNKANVKYRNFSIVSDAETVRGAQSGAPTYVIGFEGEDGSYDQLQYRVDVNGNFIR